MKQISTRIYLLLSGFVLVTVGSYISFTPVDYMHQFGLHTNGNTSFLSDLRAMGGSLVIFGLITLWGNFHKPAQLTSILVSSIVFSAYTLFRFIAYILDGMPGTLIVLASLIELAFAVTGWYLVMQQSDFDYHPFEVHP